MKLDIYLQSYKDTFLNVMQVNNLNKSEIIILIFEFIDKIILD